MHDDLKALIVIVIIPTICWGSLAYWHYLLLNGLVPGIGGYVRPDIVMPFWVVHILLLIGYLGTMIIAYLFVKKHEYEKYFWKFPKYYQKS